MDIEARLRRFEPVDLSSGNGTLDSSFADQFLKVFTRMAKAQMKTEQKVSFSVDEVKRHLDDQADLVDDLKRKRAELEDRNEQLTRFILEVVDLIFSLQSTARQSESSELQSVADTRQEALQTHMDMIGLQPIPAVGEVPDSLYHFVLDTTSVDDPAKQDRIVEVVRQGYVLNGEVIRKADVIVGK